MNRLESKIKTKKFQQAKIVPIENPENESHAPKTKVFSMNKVNLDIEEPKESAKSELFVFDSKDTGRFSDGLIT